MSNEKKSTSRFDEAMGMLYGGFSLLGGCAAGMAAYLANRFTVYEIAVFTVIGIIAGVGLALVANGIAFIARK